MSRSSGSLLYWMIAMSTSDREQGKQVVPRGPRRSVEGVQTEAQDGQMVTSVIAAGVGTTTSGAIASITVPGGATSTSAESENMGSDARDGDARTTPSGGDLEPELREGSRPLGEHVIDTGPLLCFGESVPLADLYDLLLLKDAAVVVAVRDELSRLSENSDPRRKAERRASSSVRKRFGALLNAAVVPPTPEPDSMRELEAEMQARDREKEERKGREYHATPGKHRGEVESIHVATTQGRTFVSSDMPAGLAARGRGVAVDTFVDLAVRLMRGQHEVKTRTIARELQRLVRVGLDIGGTVNGQLDLTRNYRHSSEL